MIKKALVIVPHQDDELNVAGSIFDQFKKKKIELHLLFSTNGDYEREKLVERQRETAKAIRKIGFTSVYFLGYGDGAGQDEISTSLYDTRNDEVLVSPAGKSETYGIMGQKDFRFQVSGHHSAYRLSNFKRDLRDCIFAIAADLIICVDLDFHADHKMLSLCFDEVMCDLIKEVDYRPIVLKKYAYAGAWFGADDYFQFPMKPTQLLEEEYYPNAKENEIRIHVLPRNYPFLYWLSRVYRCYNAYQTQTATPIFFHSVNADATYFFRDTRNEAICAQVHVSSGNGSYLNDFKLFDLECVTKREIDTSANRKRCTWIPDADDNERRIRLVFPKRIDIEQLMLYTSLDTNSCVRRIRVTTDRGFCKQFELPKKNVHTIRFAQKQCGVQELTIQVLEAVGSEAGFREIEVFNQESVFPWRETPFRAYDESEENLLLVRRFGVFCIKKWNDFKKTTLYLFVTKDLKELGLKYYIKRFLRIRR